MPPRYVKTLKDLIFYQYAKLIARSAGMKKQYGFITSTWKKLKNNEIKISGTRREWQHELEGGKKCIYCGSVKDLSTDHLIPRARNYSTDSADNVVISCKSCNSSKGDKGVYAWYISKGADADSIPRIVEGKYLKILYDIYDKNQMLDHGIDNLKDLCRDCPNPKVCKIYKGTKLTVLCLETILTKK